MLSKMKIENIFQLQFIEIVLLYYKHPIRTNVFRNDTFFEWRKKLTSRKRKKTNFVKTI